MKLRRVPMNFEHPTDLTWYGFLIGNLNLCHGEDETYCENCKIAAKTLGVEITCHGCPDWDAYLKEPMEKIRNLLAPPAGEGYQLWETTSEGSPVSPVFATLDELCQWCEKEATVFGPFKASKEEWKKLLEEGKDI